MPGSIECIIDSHHGVYIPQYFAESFWDIWVTDDLENPEECRQILLAGPDHEYYWDTWDNNVLDTLRFDGDDETLYLYQDGDLFVVSKDWEPDEEV